LAYNNVKIFKSDIQGLCDSLTYSQSDSIFQFFINPVLWMDSVQFTADTILAKMSEGKMQKAFMYQNSVIISTEDQVYFNQIKGRDMLANFIDNKLNTLDVQSNGKAVYYVSDNEKRYMGVNDVNCSDMFMFFSENQIQRIKFTGEPQAVLYPMKMTDHLAMRIKEFKWLEDKRPKSKFEITGNNDWSYRLKELSDTAPISMLNGEDSVKIEIPLDSLPEKTNPDSIPSLKDKSGKMGKTTEDKKEEPKPSTGKKSKLEGKKED
jgi:hypothetical protein